jgi:hypothetical protein
MALMMMIVRKRRLCFFLLLLVSSVAIAASKNATVLVSASHHFLRGGENRRKHTTSPKKRRQLQPEQLQPSFTIERANNNNRVPHRFDWHPLGGTLVGEAVKDHSGSSVALNAAGTIVAIGARVHDGPPGINSGHVRVYQLLPNNQWSLMGQDIEGWKAYDRSGYAVALSDSGWIVAIGARWYDGMDDSKAKCGQVRVYQWNETQQDWNLMGQMVEGMAAGDWLGEAVDLSSSGTRLVVASPNHGSNHQGQVRVLEYDATMNQWIPIGKAIRGEHAGDHCGISVSLSSDGTILAVGEYGYDCLGVGSNCGRVRIFKFRQSSGSTNASWTLLGNDILGEDAGDYSGMAVSLSGDGTMVAIGAPMNNGRTHTGLNHAGHARVFRYHSANNVWVPMGKDIDGLAGGDRFGRSIALSRDGTMLAVGSTLADGTGGTNHNNKQRDAGHVRIFSYASAANSWWPMGSTIEGEAVGDASGWAVALSQDGVRVAIGSPDSSSSSSAAKTGGGDTQEGSVRVFEYRKASASLLPLGSACKTNAECASNQCVGPNPNAGGTCKVVVPQRKGDGN